MPQQIAAQSNLNFVQKHIRISSKLHPRIKSDDKIQFFHHLTTLFAAGTPLLQALQIAATQSQSQKMQKVIQTIAERVAGGASLHQAASDYPKVFDKQWTEVIKTGEMSGQLSDVLTALTNYITAGREMKSQIISALIYPSIMFCVAVLAVIIMLWKVVPVFASFFTDFDSELPAITQTVINTSDFLQRKGVMIIACLIAGGLTLHQYLKTEQGRKMKSQLLLVTPMLGECIVYVQMEKFATNMVLLLRSGLPLMETIGSLQGVFHGNTVYRDAMQTIQKKIASGGGLASSMEESRLFTTMVISMVKVGEESGELAIVLEEIAKYYREKVKDMVERLTSSIEPIVILGMGVSVAVILTSIYLPMFQMAGGPS